MRLVSVVSSIVTLAVLFTPPALAQMRSGRVDHPVMPIAEFDAGRVAELKAKVDPLLAHGRDFIVGLVPERNGIANCGCPNCNQGSADTQIVWDGVANPDGAHCRFCNHRYPSEQYPMDKVLSFTNRRGEPEQWEYYEAADGTRYFFSARARYWRKWYVAQLLQDISDLYAATGEDRYADAAAELLYRISQCYAGWVVVSPDAPRPDAAPPYSEGLSIWHHWYYRDVEPSVAHAYDRLYQSGALERLSERAGVDVKQAIEQDLLYPSVEFVRACRETSSNASPILYRGLVLYGRVLNEPDFVHDGIDRAVGLLHKNYLFDGMWQETTVSYHEMTTQMMRSVFELARGYSDPPGYVHPGDGRRLDDFDAMRDVPFFRRAVNAARALVFPNGRIVPVNDAWAKTELAPPERNRPVLLPAMGHVRLARRNDHNAMQAHLHFAVSYGHRNYGNLSLILWAKGRELLSDIGYTHTAWRMWTLRTAAHNTVTVDGWDQLAMPGGNLTLYAPLSENLQVVEAEACGVYSGTVSDYRRRLLLVGTSDADAYVVDIFRVAGGRQHDWILHGSPDYEQTARTSVPIQPLTGSILGPDVHFRLPADQNDVADVSAPGLDSQPEGARRWYRLRGVGHAFIQSVGKAEVDGDWSVTFDFADDSEVHLHTTVLGAPQTTLYQISSPSIRRANENDAELPNYSMPGVLVRRAADADLASLFVSVHEPYVKQRFVSSVRSLLPIDADDAEKPVAIEVVHSTGTDYIVSGPVGAAAPAELKLPGGALICDGTIGFVRLRDGRVTAAGLVDGTQLTYGDFALSAPINAVTGEITAVEADEAAGRYAFVVNVPLPAAGRLKGSIAVVTHGDGTTHGYEIADAQQAEEKHLLILNDDPGFRVDSEGRTEFVYMPHNTVEGVNRFRIGSVVSYEVGP